MIYADQDKDLMLIILFELYPRQMIVLIGEEKANHYFSKNK